MNADPCFRVLKADRVRNKMTIEHLHGNPPRVGGGIRLLSKWLDHPLVTSNIWFFIRVTPTDELGIYDVAVRPASYEELPLAEQLDHDVFQQLFGGRTLSYR